MGEYHTSAGAGAANTVSSRFFEGMPFKSGIYFKGTQRFFGILSKRDRKSEAESDSLFTWTGQAFGLPAGRST
jgi:hypothetical protein